jgi:hypothetical protein
LRWLGTGHQVTAWVCDQSVARNLLGSDVELASTNSTSIGEQIPRAYALINLAGEPVLAGRWTASRKGGQLPINPSEGRLYPQSLGRVFLAPFPQIQMAFRSSLTMLPSWISSADDVIDCRPTTGNFSTVFAGQAVGIKEVHDDIWRMDYDLGYFDLETRVLEPLDNPFALRLSPM